MIPSGSTPEVAATRTRGSQPRPRRRRAGDTRRSPAKTYWAFTPEQALRALRFVAYRKTHMKAQPPKHIGTCLHVAPELVTYLRERAA